MFSDFIFVARETFDVDLDDLVLHRSCSPHCRVYFSFFFFLFCCYFGLFMFSDFIFVARETFDVDLDDLVG